ncbi:MAG: helix-turn-helix domain-containing protein [Octadecabacter sp.]
MFSIGQLSSKTGVKIPTIRYYEDIGIITNAGRSAGNQRRYDDAGLRRLAFVKHARDLGLPLDAIRELIALDHGADQPCEDAHRIAADHLQHLRNRIARLQTLERELTRIASVHDSGYASDCQVIAALADHHLCETSH